MTIPSRLVHMPVAFDESTSRAAVERYINSIRKDAPNCEGGNNIDYVVRYNGFEDREELYERFSRPSSGRRSSASSPGSRSCFPSTRASTVSSSRSTTRRARGRRRERSASGARASRSTRSSRPAATSSSAERSRSTTCQGATRVFRENPLLLRAGDRVTFHRVERGGARSPARRTSERTATATRSRTAPSTSAPTSSWTADDQGRGRGATTAPRARRRGHAGSLRPRRRCENPRDPRGRDPDDGSGLPGPPRHARAGLLPRRADGPLRAHGPQTCSSETRSLQRGSRSHSAETSRSSLDGDRRGLRRRGRGDGRRRDGAAVGEPTVPAGTELRDRDRARPGLPPVSRCRRRDRRAAALRLARDLHDGGPRRPRGPSAPDRATASRSAEPRGPNGGAGGSMPRSAAAYARDWEIEAMRGPQAAPDFLTEEDMATLFGRDVDGRSELEPHGHPARVAQVPVGAGERRHCRRPSVEHPRQQLPGRCRQRQRRPPRHPRARRADGGGFVVAATVVHAGFWKVGQLRPVGDTVSFPRGHDRGGGRARPRSRRGLAEASLETPDREDRSGRRRRSSPRCRARSTGGPARGGPVRDRGRPREAGDVVGSRRDHEELPRDQSATTPGRRRALPRGQRGARRRRAGHHRPRPPEHSRTPWRRSSSPTAARSRSA